MTAKPRANAPTGRKKIAQGKERSDDALGHESPNTASTDGTKEGDELPTGWKWKTIPDLISDDGVFIDGDWVESKDQDPNGDVRLIQLADVGDGVFRDKSDRFMSKAKADELRCTFLKQGDVLIARMPDPLGRACIFPGDAKPSVTVVDVAVVRSGNGEFDHRWLACFVNAYPFRSAISGLQAGSTRKRISRGNLATIPLPVPPHAEQRRIVAEIEKQFTRLEVGVAALKRVQANLKRYRAAVLKAACEGRLVPTEAELAKTRKQKANFETGEQLLARILNERRQNWQGRGQYKEPAAPDTTKLGPLPKGWIWASADQVSSQITDGEHIQPRYTPEGFPMLSAKHVRNGFVIYTDVPFISEADFQVCLKRCAPTRDDILIVCVGATTGRAAIVGDAEPFAVVRSVLLIRTLVHPRFMLAWVQSPWCQTWIQSASGSSAQAHFYINNAKQMCVPLPPLAEQTRIVAEVERRLSVVEELETVVSANLQRAARLRQSILQKAFTGELFS